MALSGACTEEPRVAPGGTWLGGAHITSDTLWTLP